MPTSPDVQNYHIGKGIVTFKETSGSTFVDLGNAPSFVYTPAVEKKEHFSSREGVKTKDFTAITQVGASVKFTLDEITGLNLSFFALGDQDTRRPAAIPLPAWVMLALAASSKVAATTASARKLNFEATVSSSRTGSSRLLPKVTV